MTKSRIGSVGMKKEKIVTRVVDILDEKGKDQVIRVVDVHHEALRIMREAVAPPMTTKTDADADAVYATTTLMFLCRFVNL